jgi:hypothetical protein
LLVLFQVNFVHVVCKLWETTYVNYGANLLWGAILFSYSKWWHMVWRNKFRIANSLSISPDQILVVALLLPISFSRRLQVEHFSSHLLPTSSPVQLLISFVVPVTFSVVPS